MGDLVEGGHEGLLKYKDLQPLLEKAQKVKHCGTDAEEEWLLVHAIFYYCMTITCKCIASLTTYIHLLYLRQ